MYHPDSSKQAGSEQMFKQCSAAYDVLGDIDTKKAYDSARRSASGERNQYYDAQTGHFR